MNKSLKDVVEAIDMSREHIYILQQEPPFLFQYELQAAVCK